MLPGACPKLFAPRVAVSAKNYCVATRYNQSSYGAMTAIDLNHTLNQRY